MGCFHALYCITILLISSNLFVFKLSGVRIGLAEACKSSSLVVFYVILYKLYNLAIEIMLESFCVMDVQVVSVYS